MEQRTNVRFMHRRFRRILLLLRARAGALNAVCKIAGYISHNRAVSLTEYIETTAQWYSAQAVEPFKLHYGIEHVAMATRHASTAAQELALVARSNLVLSSLDPVLYAQFTKCHDLFRKAAVLMQTFSVSAYYAKNAWINRNLYSIEGE
jgi:hypothetical protein